jgi:hypothetical protein
MKCLGDFLRCVPWRPAEARIPFRLITQLSDPNPRDPRDKEKLSTARQRQELTSRLATHPKLVPELRLQHWKAGPLHMRYAYFVLERGEQLLYILERGLDMESPQTGTARADSYVLEFRNIPIELRTMLRLSAS